MALGDYTKTSYVNGVSPAINSTNLNNHENKTKELDTELLSVKTKLDTPDTQSLTLSAGTTIDSVTDSYASPSDVSVDGTTINQIVVNGDYASGTTGWSGVAASLSESSNVLKITKSSAGGSFGSAEKTGIFNATTKYFVKARMRNVGSFQASSLLIRQGSTILETVYSPVINTWYDLTVVFDSTTTDTLRLTVRGVGTEATEMEVDGNTGVFAIPITGTPYESYTADEMNDLVSEYFERLKSVESVSFGSRGKNILPDTLNNISITDETYGNLIRVEPNKVIYLKQTVEGFFRSTAKFYDKNQNEITSGITFSEGALVYLSGRWISSTDFSDATLLTTVVANPNIYYVDYTADVRVGSTSIALSERLISQETTTYEPYEGSNIDITCNDNTLFDMAEVPNGTVNSVDLIGGKFSVTKRIARYVLTEDDIFSFVTSLTNIDRISIIKPLDSVMYNAASASDETAILNNYPELEYADATANVETVDFGANSTYIYLSVAKATYADLATAKTALAGTVLYYELATPITKQEEDFADFDITLTGSLSSNLDYTEYFVDTYDILPSSIDIDYAGNISRAVEQLKNSTTELKDAQMDTILSLLELDAKIIIEENTIDAHIADLTNPHVVTKSQVDLGNVENYAIASQAEAESGTSNVKYMTPLRTQQAISERITGSTAINQSIGASSTVNIDIALGGTYYNARVVIMYNDVSGVRGKYNIMCFCTTINTETHVAGYMYVSSGSNFDAGGAWTRARLGRITDYGDATTIQYGERVLADSDDVRINECFITGTNLRITVQNKSASPVTVDFLVDYQVSK